MLGLLAVATGVGATGEYYYVLDGQSSVIGLVDAAGTERARYTYDPYGAHDTAVAVNGALPDNRYRYASGRAVALNASNQVVLYQYGQRFYQRSVGRWTQQDNLESLGDPTQGNPALSVSKQSVIPGSGRRFPALTGIAGRLRGGGECSEAVDVAGSGGDLSGSGGGTVQ